MCNSLEKLRCCFPDHFFLDKLRTAAPPIKRHSSKLSVFPELRICCIFAKRCLRRPCFCIFSPSCEVVPRYTMCDKVNVECYQNPQLGRRHVLCSSCRISSTTRVATTLRRNYVATQFLVALQLGKKWKNGKIPNFENSFGFGRHPVARGSSELPFAAAHPCPHTPHCECRPNAVHSIFI